MTTFSSRGTTVASTCSNTSLVFVGPSNKPSVAPGQSLTARAEFIELPAEKALATGLIINELVTNAFKYAFPDDDAAGHIKVEVTSAEQDVILNVNDDGVGRPVESKGGLGTRLVTVFAGQLGGAAHWTRDGSPGCKVSIRFPK